MGLSASQARLLTITARKSDCEYESMRLSHQKIALSRDMDVVSAEYQDAINQTKLIYDFYGNNSKVNPLSYNLLMSPSALNDYIPTTITDKSGRVVLSPELARAAKAAGIPQEGMDGLPSSDMRNAFIDGLMANDVISAVQGENIKKTTYNQMAGVGSEDLVNVNTAEASYSQFVEMLDTIKFDFSDLLANAGGSDLKIYDNVSGQVYEDNFECSLADILNGNITLEGCAWDNDQLRGQNNLYDFSVVDKVATSSFWEQMFDAIESMLDTGDPYTQSALEYARKEIMESIECLSDPENGIDHSNAAYYNKHKHKSQSKIEGWIHDETQNYVGFVWEQNEGGGYNDGYGLNLTYMSKAYLTYFAIYMQGFNETDYNVEKLREQTNFVDDMFSFTYVTDVDTSGDNLLIAGFYDALFNQICLNGWTENDKINDNEYLEEMLKSGAMYMSTLADDGYYYQGNYSTNTYIKEVTDEKAVAQAEAKYNREKQKINSKENIIDMKMKNLDTEISALTTEYDTVKSVIDKNIEKTFKRYNA